VTLIAGVVQLEQLPLVIPVQVVHIPVQSQITPFQVKPSTQTEQFVEEGQSAQFRGQAMHSRLVTEREKPILQAEQVVVRACVQVAQLAITKLQFKQLSPAAFR